MSQEDEVEQFTNRSMASTEFETINSERNNVSIENGIATTKSTSAENPQSIINGGVA